MSGCEFKYSTFRAEEGDLVVVGFDMDKTNTTELSFVLKQIEKHFEGRNKVIAIPNNVTIERMGKKELSSWIAYAKGVLGREMEAEHDENRQGKNS